MATVVYVVQGDPVDHHGEILLVTTDYDRAMHFCFRKILFWNNEPEDKFIHRDAKTMTKEDFLDKYLGSAWITTPQMSEYKLRDKRKNLDNEGPNNGG